ncbi:LCP family protein, partial [Ralstonia sp. VS2407]
VDAVGGVELTVRDRIPIGGIGAPVTGYVEPGTRTLTGFETLWFARSRVAADDYSRMARQKCVMNAMLQQLSPRTVVMNFQKIADAGEALITTDIPQGDVDRFMKLALQARSQPVRTVSFVPPMISTGDPDIAKIQAAVDKAVDPPEA